MEIEKNILKEDYSNVSGKLFVSANYLNKKLPVMLFGFTGIYITKAAATSYIVDCDEVWNIILKKLSTGEYSFDLIIHDGIKELCNYRVNIEDIKNYLADFSAKAYKEKLKEMGELVNPSKKKRKLLKQKITNNLSFLDIVNILKENPKIFSQKFLSGNLGVSGETLYEIIANRDIVNFCCDELNESEIKNVKTNIYLIKYNYEPDEEYEKDFQTYEGLVDEVEINPKVLEKMYENMSDEYNQTEKIIQVYYNLCKLFTYEDENFVSHKISDLHKNINHIKDIVPGDKILCFELIMIIAKYLKSQNIPYRIVNQYDEINDKYGQPSHSKIICKTDEMLVEIDPITHYFVNDMANVRFGRPMLFLKAYKSTKRKINILESYKKNIENRMKDDYPNKNIELMIEAHNQLKETDKSDLTIKDKIDLLVMFIKSNKQPPLDIYDWFKGIEFYLFNGNIKYDNIEYIGKTGNPDSAVICITANENGVNEDIENNNYYIIQNGKLLEQLSYEEMKEKIKTGEYFFTSDERYIPGIDNPNNNKERQK